MPRIAIHVIIVVMVAQLTTGAPAVGRAQDTGTPAEIPATPVGDQLAWLITLLNGGTEPPTEMDVASHFTPAALAELPPPVIIGVAQQFAEVFGPFTYQGPARPTTPNQIVGYLTGRDEASFLVVLATEATPPHQLTGAALLPVPPLAELPPLAPESLNGQFDVGGRTLSISCSGTGSPTVILEAGYGDSGSLWAPVQNGVAPRTRVCSYDRPNVSAGASDPAPTPRTAEDQVADLHALLTAAGIAGPYVLGAHSYGGLISRLYAATYPGKVVGMVLVDTVHEDRAAQRQAIVSPEQWAALQDLETQVSDFERIDEEASWEQVRRAQGAAPLWPMPLLVLAAGIGTDPSFFPPDWPIAEEEQLHRKLQVELAGLSPHGQYVLVGESGHYIQLEQPDVVIDAIAAVVEAVRATSGLATPGTGTPTTPTTVAIPETVADTPVGEALAWVLTVLNDGATPLTPEEMTARFAPAFLEAVPPETMVGLTQQIAAGGPYSLKGFTRPPTANQVNALLIGHSGTPLLVPLSVEAATPHRITGVNFAPVPPPPGVQLQTMSTDEAPLVEGEVRTTETERFAGLFEVDGREIYLSCAGTGSPTVVLESGLNDPAAPWFAVESAVVPFTRVCSYDRANTAGGASDPAPTPRTVQDAVDDLHVLLTAAQVPGPYLLVGHSTGGLTSRLYASAYPDDVDGLVLVDAAHEEQEARIERLVSPEMWEAYQEMAKYVLNLEGIDIDASFAQVREARAAAPLRPMPLIVVSAGVAEDPSVVPTFFPPGWPVEVMPQLHRELQADLATLVPNARLVVAERSGHYVHQSEPELVVEAIKDVVDAVRNPETWDMPVPGTPASVSQTVASFDRLLEAGVEGGQTGVALAVDLDGKILYDGAVGLANSETQTPLSHTDRFRIYSITKSFTAVLVLQLVDEGVLALDDTVADWLDDPAVARIPNVEQITLRQLLTHTSGVYDYFAEDSPFWQDAYLGEDADWSRVWTPEELLAYADGANHAPDFAPGKGVRYSNTGYILLGLIVEEATSQAFADRLHQRILDPLGLTNTFFAATEPVPGGTVQGYHLLGGDLVNVSATHLSAQWTEGGMVSTTQDLMRFADALFGGELLQPASLQEMLTFVPSERPGIAWGMGVAQMHTATGDVVGMAGDGPGFVARMFQLPELDLTVVLLTNTNRDDETVDVLFEEVVQVALETAP